MRAPMTKKRTGLASVSIFGRLSEKSQSIFWSRVDTSGGTDACWPWTARVNSEGYGQFDAANKSGLFAQRVAFELRVRQLVPGELVCHHCDNPPCCNPAHLFVGTHLDNNRDRHAKGRSAPIQRPDPSQLSRGDDHYARQHPERLARGERHWSKTHPERIPRGIDHHARRHPERLVRGSDSPNAKLTEDQVRDIKRLLASDSPPTKAALARAYGVSEGPIYSIATGRSWKHVK